MKRERLGSRLGFILLSAGCAIGIGNVWKFPYMVGQYGGGIFISGILNMSGGGVTFSGGEPLCQADFVLACMELLRGKTNRAIQTAGHVPVKRFQRVLRECDYVLYDLKLMDSEQHRRYTLAGNEWILENYRTLAKSGVPFTTRIPLIPSVNDTEENIEATARFLRECGVSYIELLPYNKMAGGKYRMLGREYTIDFDPSLVPNAREEIFHRYGVEVKIL